MGLFSNPDEQLAAEAVEAGRAAWAAGGGHFVHQLRAGIGTKNDFGKLLSLALDGIVEVGWNLRSVTPYVNSLGPNNLEALLVFERPG